MPHLIIEHTQGVDAKELVIALEENLGQHPETNRQNVKARSTQVFNAIVAGVSEREFIFIQLKLMRGRTPEQLQRIGKSLQNCALELTNQKVAVATEITEINPEHYWTHNP